DNTMNSTVTFPACTLAIAPCTFATTTFFAQPPPPAIIVDHLEDDVGFTDHAYPRVMLRLDEPSAITEGQLLHLVGENFHPDIEVFIAPPSIYDDPALWSLYPMDVEFLNDTTSVDVF